MGEGLGEGGGGGGGGGAGGRVGRVGRGVIEGWGAGAGTGQRVDAAAALLQCERDAFMFA